MTFTKSIIAIALLASVATVADARPLPAEENHGRPLINRVTMEEFDTVQNWGLKGMPGGNYSLDPLYHKRPEYRGRKR